MSSTEAQETNEEKKPSSEFRGHPLPQSCPPNDASAFSQQIVLRLVTSDPCTNDDFLSCHAKGARPPTNDYDECRWRACSVFLDVKKGKRRLLSIAKLPSHKDKKYIAHLAVDENSGVAKPWPSDPTHISFWMYDSFDAVGAASKLEPVA